MSTVNANLKEDWSSPSDRVSETTAFLLTGRVFSNDGPQRKHTLISLGNPASAVISDSIVWACRGWQAPPTVATRSESTQALVCSHNGEPVAGDGRLAACHGRLLRHLLSRMARLRSLALESRWLIQAALRSFTRQSAYGRVHERSSFRPPRLQLYTSFALLPL